jgi:hypothetical protein
MLFQSRMNVLAGLLRHFSPAKKLLMWAPGIYEADFPINRQNVDPGLPYLVQGGDSVFERGSPMFKMVGAIDPNRPHRTTYAGGSMNRPYLFSLGASDATSFSNRGSLRNGSHSGLHFSSP